MFYTGRHFSEVCYATNTLKTRNPSFLDKMNLQWIINFLKL